MTARSPNPYLDTKGKPIADFTAKGPAVRPFALVKPDKVRPEPAAQFARVNAVAGQTLGVTAKPLPPLPVVNTSSACQKAAALITPSKKKQ